jgi:hypothetical protein
MHGDALVGIIGGIAAFMNGFVIKKNQAAGGQAVAGLLHKVIQLAVYKKVYFVIFVQMKVGVVRLQRTNAGAEHRRHFSGHRGFSFARFAIKQAI